VTDEDVGSSEAEDRVPPSNKPGFSFADTRLGGEHNIKIRADTWIRKNSYLTLSAFVIKIKI